MKETPSFHENTFIQQPEHDRIIYTTNGTAKKYNLNLNSRYDMISRRDNRIKYCIDRCSTPWKKNILILNIND